MAFTTPWQQPYPELKSLPESAIRTLRIDIPASEARVISSLATNPSIFSFICQNALKSAVEHIRTNNLTYLDADELVRWVRERSTSRTPTETAGPNDAGGDKEIRSGTPASATEPALVGKDAKTERGAGEERVGGSVLTGGVSLTTKRRIKIKAE